MKNYRARKGYGKRKEYSYGQRKAYYIGLGAGANVDQLVSHMMNMSESELESFFNGHDFWQNKNNSLPWKYKKEK